MSFLNSKQKFEKFNDTDLEPGNNTHIAEGRDSEYKSNAKLENKDGTNFDNNDDLSSKKEENLLVIMNRLIDDMGFSKYHLLIFTIAALILICGGVQELMLSIVLSMITKKDNLSHYHMAIITTSEYMGYTTATILVNIITNYISSRRAIQIFAVLTLISTGVSIFSIHFYLATFSRFFTGVCLGMIDILIYLNLLESCPTKIRGFVGSFILIFFPLGQFLTSIFCYFQLNTDPDANFRNLLLIPFITVAALIIVLLPFLQDSARRMGAEKNVKGSMEVVKKISIFNKDDAFLHNKEKIMNELVRKASEENIGEAKRGKIKKANTMFVMDHQRKISDLQSSGKGNNMPNDVQNDINNGDNRQENNNNADKLDNNLLVVTPIYDRKSFKLQLEGVLDNKHFKFSIIFWTLATLTGFIFNGVFFMLPTTPRELETSTLKDVIISVSMEIPSNFLVYIMIENKSIGRLKLLKIGYFSTIIICLICFICGYDYLIINCLLKFFITIPTNVLLVYGSEIYEGRVRTFGVSSINFFRRLATIASPFIVTYMDYKFGPLGPYFIFAPFSILAFIISTRLDIETRGVPLDEII